MTGEPNNRDACRAFRDAVDDALDAEDVRGVDAYADGVFAEHARRCTACHEYAEEQAAIRRALAALPAMPLPDDAVERILALTIDSPVRRHWRVAGFSAAAALAIAVSLWMVQTNSSSDSTVGSTVAVDVREDPADDDPQELVQAARETRLVLELTSEALARVEEAATRDAIVKRVSDSLIGVPWRITARVLGSS